MTAHPPSRLLAQSTLDALKREGHIVLAPGGSELVLREMGLLIEPVLTRVLSKIDRSPIMGEVSSSFGDEATDEAVEELVSSMREALLDSEGVEDVFADDRSIERAIFRTFAESIVKLAQRDEEEEERPPISVRLDTLGYVAAAAAKSADDGTLREALDRAAEAAQSELKTFDDKTRTAFFHPVDPDPERRLDIEAAIEEELSDLVDLGVVELPTITRTIPLPPLSEASRKTLRKRLDDLAQKHLTISLCPGSWDWSDDKRAVTVVFTPLTEPDMPMVERAADTFRSEVEAILSRVSQAADDAPKSSKRSPASGRTNDAPPSSTKKAGAKAAGPADADMSFLTRVLAAAASEKKPAGSPTANKSKPAAEDTKRSATTAKPKRKAAAKPKSKKD